MLQAGVGVNGRVGGTVRRLGDSGEGRVRRGSRAGGGFDTYSLRMSCIRRLVSPAALDMTVRLGPPAAKRERLKTNLSPLMCAGRQKMGTVVRRLLAWRNTEF